MSARTVTVFEVIYDGPGAGAAGDGVHIYRSRKRSDAETFARRNTAWGRPTSVSEAKVPPALARRWGL